MKGTETKFYVIFFFFFRVMSTDFLREHFVDYEGIKMRNVMSIKRKRC